MNGQESPAAPSPVIRFATFEVDLRAKELRRSGLKINLQKQPFQILEMLLERAGELVTREEIRSRIWPADTFVDFEHSVNTAVKNSGTPLEIEPRIRCLSKLCRARAFAL